MSWNLVQPDVDWRIEQWATTNCHAGPFQHGTDLYVLLQYNDGTQLGMFKSADSGATWSLVGAGPTSAAWEDIGLDADGDNGPATHYCADVNGSTIHVVYWQTFFDDYPTADDSTATMAFIAFDMATDTWGTPVTGPTIPVYSVISSGISPAFDIPLGLHYRPSTSDLVALWQIEDSRSIVSVYFAAASTSGSVTSGPTAALTNNYVGFTQRITGGILRSCLSTDGGAYWVNVFASSVKDLVHITIDDSNALGTLQTLGTLGVTPLDHWGPWGAGSSPPQYDAVTMLPFAIGADIVYPFWEVNNSAFEIRYCVFRASAAANPAWAFSDQSAVFNPVAPVSSFAKRTLVACVDASANPTILMVARDGIWSSTWSSGAWSTLAQLEAADTADDLNNYIGALDGFNYFSTRVVLGQLDAVWGYGQDYGFGNTLRTGTTLQLSVTPPAAGGGNCWDGMTQMPGNCFG